MQQISFNLYPILNFIIILFAIIGGYSLLKDVINTLSRGYKDKLDNKKDSEMIQALSNKDIRIITVENSRDIHELNQRISMLEYKYKEVFNGHTNN